MNLMMAVISGEIRVWKNYRCSSLSPKQTGKQFPPTVAAGMVCDRQDSVSAPARGFCDWDIKMLDNDWPRSEGLNCSQKAT